MKVELTIEERDQMAHAIGHATAPGCSTRGGRNYYATLSDDPVWVELVRRGLATVREYDEQTSAVFFVTPKGRAAVEADPRTVEALLARGRRYVIKFRGYEDERPSYAWGITRGKAKSAAARVVADCFPDNDAFMHIVSCKLAGGSA